MKSLREKDTATVAMIFHGHGNMARQMREFDWSLTELGQPEAWPQTLRTAVGLVLGSPYPMCVWWGPRLISLYNDAFLNVIGNGYSVALGEPMLRFAEDVLKGSAPGKANGTDEHQWEHLVSAALSFDNRFRHGLLKLKCSPLFENDLTIGGLVGTITNKWDESPSGNNHPDQPDSPLDVESIELPTLTHEDLEHQIHARTQELKTINAALRKEGDERNRIETALRASEERMRRAITIETVGVIFFNAEGVITDANDAFLNMSGYTREDFRKGYISWEDLTPPEFRSASSKAIHDVLTKGETTPYEKQYIRKDGSRWWGLFAARRLSENDHVKFVLDITERKRAEEALAADLRDTRLLRDVSSHLIHEDDSNALYDQILDAAIAVTHSDMGRLQMFDPETNKLRLLASRGFDPDSAASWDWIGIDAGTSCASAFKSGLREIVRDVEDCEFIQGTNLDSYRRSGIRAMQSTPLLSRGGHLVGMISNYWVKPHEPTERDLQLLDVIARQAADLIERRKAQESLRESEERFRAIISQTIVGIEHSDLDGKIRFANHTLAEMLGYDETELAGKPLRDLTVQEDAEKHLSLLQRMAETGMAFHIDERLIRKDGSSFWSSVSVSPLRDARGKAESAIAIVIDITERKRAEVEREVILGREQAARAEAEEANRLKDEFLATVSHELRSPLNSIFGWVRLLQSASLNEVEVRRALDTIERSARSQAQLIEDLLEVSRIITGKMRLNIRQVDLPRTVTAAVDSIRPTAQAKGVRLETLIDPFASPVSGDEERLQQVVWNLLSNAVKFTPQGGLVQVTLQRTHSHAEIVVTDTGQGINREFLPHVFERFKQASAGSIRKYGGLGLGLAIVRHLVELHGGYVSASSPGEGKGATFRVRLPVMLHREEGVGSDLKLLRPTESQLTLDGVSALVVDDDAEARLLLRAIIEKAGATVFTASSASEGRELLAIHKIDVIISDIEMPDEDGYSFIKSVHSIKELNRIPAIALTAYARAEDRQRTLFEGFQLHLSKPVEPAELTAVVKSLAGKAGTDS